MFKSLESIASVVGIVMYLTISKFKQVLRSRKGLGKVSTTTLDNVGEMKPTVSSRLSKIGQAYISTPGAGLYTGMCPL